MAMPQTRAGRLLLGKNAGGDPVHTEWLLNDIIAIENEARRTFLDELMATGFIQASIGLSYEELDEALARHRLRLIAALHEEQKGQIAPSNLGGGDG